MAGIWSFVVIAGPIVLIAAIIFAWLRNRNASKSTLREADRGAVDLSQQTAKDRLRAEAVPP